MGESLGVHRWRMGGDSCTRVYLVAVTRRDEPNAFEGFIGHPFGRVGSSLLLLSKRAGGLPSIPCRMRRRLVTLRSWVQTHRHAIYAYSELLALSLLFIHGV